MYAYIHTHTHTIYNIYICIYIFYTLLALILRKTLIFKFFKISESDPTKNGSGPDVSGSNRFQIQANRIRAEH